MKKTENGIKKLKGLIMKRTLLVLLAASLCGVAAAQEGRILKNGPIAITLNQEAGVSMQGMPKPHNVDKKYKDVARIEDVRLSDEQVNYIADKIVVTRNIPLEEAQRLKKRNPQIIFSKYTSSTYLKHWPLEEIERDYMQDLAMCPAAVLENDIDRSTTEFTVSHYTWPKNKITEPYFDKVNVDIDVLKENAPEIRGYNDLIPIYASTIEEEAEFSEHGRKFLFFIRIAGELMRVNQWDKESGKLRVTRGYKGSRATDHYKGDVVTSPIYCASGTPIIESGFNFFSKAQAAKLAKNRASKEPGLFYCSDKSAANIPILERRGQELVEYMQQGYDGVNLDAMSATIPQFRMVNALTMKTGPWNFEKNRPYSVDEWVEGHDRMVGVMQRYAYAETGRWPTIIANGVSSANFEKGDGNGGYSKRLLVPTKLKSRPMVSYNTEKGCSACGSAFEDQFKMLQIAFQDHLAPSMSFKAPHYAYTQKTYDRNLNYAFAFLYLAFEPKPEGWDMTKDGPGFIFRSSYFSPWFHLPSAKKNPIRSNSTDATSTQKPVIMLKEKSLWNQPQEKSS